MLLLALSVKSLKTRYYLSAFNASVGLYMNENLEHNNIIYIITALAVSIT